MMKNINICVIGGGIIGLSTAVNIIENMSDVKVDIMAEKFSPHTTSDIAAGMWDPHDVNVKDTEAFKLADTTFQYMRDLSTTEHAAQVGAFMLSGYYISQNKFQPPIYKDLLNGFREMTKGELLTFPGYSYGFGFTTIMLECNKYMPWLMKRFEQRGGRMTKKKISSISELSSRYDIVVNCTGLGACDLAHDKKVKPARGQMVRVQAPWIKHAVFDVGNPLTYIIPRRDHVLLGGTREDGNFDTKVNVETRKRIMAGCEKLIPSLKYAKFEGDLVGLRPHRSTVRLEREEVLTDDKNNIQVVHNYGHCGSGVALHWGCALKATSLVQEAVHRIRTKCKL